MGNRRDHLILFLLVAIALALRVWRIDLVHFNIDEATAASLATQMGHARAFHLRGIRTSFGFTNPPEFIYLLTPIFAVTRSPLLASALIAIVGSLAVLPAWRSGHLLGGAKAALAAALIVAVCPNAVEHSRRLWGHDLIVFMSALSTWAAIEAAHRRSSRWLLLSMACAALAQTLHLSGALLWLTPLCVYTSIRDLRRPSTLGWALGMVALLYLPWCIAEIREGFPDLRTIAGTLHGGGLGRDLGVPVSPGGAWTMVLGDFWSNDLLGAARPWQLSRACGTFSLVLSVVALLLLGAAIIFLVRQIRNGEAGNRPVALALLLPILATPLCFGLILSAAVPPYQLPVLIPAALGAAWMLSRLRPAALATVLIVYTAASVGMTLAVRDALANGAGSNASLGEKIAVVSEIGRQTRGAMNASVCQNGRPAGTVDVSYGYLVYALKTTNRPPAAGLPLFVIVEDSARLRPELEEFLRPLDTFGFKHTRLYKMNVDASAQWLQLLESYPAPHR